MEIKQANETKSSRKDGKNNNINGTTVHSFTDPTLDPDRVTVTVTAGATIAPISKVRYRECLKNHAAIIGGNVYDGCGEFMAGGQEGTLEALKCAACDCHRNFHRKDFDYGDHQTPHNLMITGTTRRSSSSAIMLNPFQLQNGAIVAPIMNVAFGGATESSCDEDLNVFHSDEGVVQHPPPPPFVLSKKRFRTKFTQEQKDKMMGFAEKVGWRFQKQDEEELEKFCADVGVKRRVFKVWMHNNKNNVKNKQQTVEMDLETIHTDRQLESSNLNPL